MKIKDLIAKLNALSDKEKEYLFVLRTGPSDDFEVMEHDLVIKHYNPTSNWPKGYGEVQINTYD